MPQKQYRNSNLFSIDFGAIEAVLEDANAPIISQSELLISKALQYPDEIYENATAEEMQFFLAQLRLQAKQVAQARLSDGRSFSDAGKVVQSWFGNTENKLKTADKRIAKTLSSYAANLHAQAEDVRRRNEEKQRFLGEEAPKKDVQIGQSISGESIITAKPPNSVEGYALEGGLEIEPELPSVSLVWQVKDFDINQLDLEKLRSFLTPFAIKNAINSHIKKYGANQISGVEYEQTVASKLLPGKSVGAREPDPSKPQPPIQGMKLSEQTMLGANSHSRQLSEELPTTNETIPPRNIESNKIPGAGLVNKTNFAPRKVEEPWGSREAFKEDRASWKKGGS